MYGKACTALKKTRTDILLAYADTLSAEQSDWCDVTLHRFTRPDIQFSGRRIYVIERAVNRILLAHISLWKARKGGFVLSWSDLSDGSIVRYAVKLKSLSDVMDHLEDICASQMALADAPWLHARGWQTMTLTFVSDLQKKMGFQRIFLAIASEALSVWDGWRQD